MDTAENKNFAEKNSARTLNAQNRYSYLTPAFRILKQNPIQTRFLLKKII